jgi:hypothetical protein
LAVAENSDESDEHGDLRCCFSVRSRYAGFMPALACTCGLQEIGP